MNDADFQKLKETSWQRELTAAEQAALDGYLAANLSDRTQWEEEAGLNRLLGKLPDAPVSSNFTSQVLQAVERENVAPSRGERGLFHWFKFNWLPRMAIACLLFCGGFISIQQYKRAQVANDVAAVSTAATVPRQWLEDFDAINRLSQPPVDNELLAALQ